jgi:hydrogenase maturation protease
MFKKPVLIIGLGNPLRSDDGIGPHACELIDRLQWPGVATMAAHQLFPETVMEMEGYATVIIMDAMAEGEAVRLEKVEPSTGRSISISHHVSPNVLSTLQSLITGKKSDIYICGIPGGEFGHGERLSPKALLNLQKAISLIASKIN